MKDLSLSIFRNTCIYLLITQCRSKIKQRVLEVLNPFPNKLLFSRYCSTNLLKTQWEKEELLVTRLHILEVLNSFPNKPLFLRVCSTNLLKTQWEKEKLIKTRNFSFSHSVFYLSGEFSLIFIELKIVVCKPFQFGRL